MLYKNILSVFNKTNRWWWWRNRLSAVCTGCHGLIWGVAVQTTAYFLYSFSNRILSYPCNEKVSVIIWLYCFCRSWRLHLSNLLVIWWLIFLLRIIVIEQLRRSRSSSTSFKKLLLACFDSVRSTTEFLNVVGYITSAFIELQALQHFVNLPWFYLQGVVT